MKIKSSKKYRSLLVRGTKALAITSVLFGIVSCSHDKTDTDNSSSISEVTTQCTTTFTTTTTCTTTSTSTTTTVAMTTTTVPQTTIVWESTVPIETAPPTTVYVEPVNNDLPITEYERILLCNVVAREYGADWISVYDKACVVATVMNRVNSPQFPNSIEAVLTQPDQFSGYYACGYEWSNVTDSVREAVYYYFNHQYEFGSYLYFYGDGQRNYFY